MFGKDDSVENLSRELDRARGRRDALASEVKTLTAQIAEMEARLSEEKTRRERDRALGEIEAIKKRIKDTSAFAPVIGKLCEAIERAAAGSESPMKFSSSVTVGLHCTRASTTRRSSSTPSTSWRWTATTSGSCRCTFTRTTWRSCCAAGRRASSWHRSSRARSGQISSRRPAAWALRDWSPSIALAPTAPADATIGSR